MKGSNDSDYKTNKRETTISNLFAQFKAQFTSEEDCVEEIYSFIMPENGFRCNHCNSKIIKMDYGARNAKCNLCSRNSWITADSFFCRTRRLFPWLLYIWMIDNGITLNSIELSKLSGLATSSSQHIIKKVGFVLKEVMKNKINTTAHSSKFIQVISKRSRETPAREHPRAEIKGIIQKNKSTPNPNIRSVNSNSNTNTSTDSAQKQLSKSSINGMHKAESSDIEKLISNVLYSNPAHIDSICQLTNLSINTLIPSLTLMEVAQKIKSIGGGFYKLTENYSCSQGQPNSPISKFSLKKTRSFIRRVFQGVSRKYLQIYLATHWYKTKISKMNSSNNLLQLCVDYGDISHRTIYSYISPLFLRTFELRQKPVTIKQVPELYLHP